MAFRWLATILLLASASGAWAQGYPTEPVRIVVPYAPGGTQDLIARVLQDPLSKALGQPVIVLNKPGAAGAIGTREVANAKPDGYTLILSNNGPHSILPALKKDLGYDGLKSFAPISQVASTPYFLIVNPGVPVSDLKEFVAYARANPGVLDFASSGIGSMAHLAGEMLALKMGAKVVHVPYKGQSETVLAVMSGQVKFAVTTSSPAVTTYIADKKLKMLGVTTLAPSPLAPGVPTIASVLPGYDVDLWFGLLAPAGTPPAIVTKLNGMTATILKEATVRKRFSDMSVLPKWSEPGQLATMIAGELPRWAEVVRETAIPVD